VLTAAVLKPIGDSARGAAFAVLLVYLGVGALTL